MTISHAEHTAVLSLPQLRRLRFPIGGKFDLRRDDAGRAVLAALALVGLTLAAERGFDLRSRCLLLPSIQAPSPHQRKYADGHIMGLGVIIPREIPARDRAKAFGRILFDERTNKPRIRKLTLGRAGELHVVPDTSFSPKHNLRPLTWTQPSTCWRSVTPIVLDRIPKSDRVTERHKWNEEVAELINVACKNIGLSEAIRLRERGCPTGRWP